MKSKSIRSELPNLTIVVSIILFIFIIPANIMLQLQSIHQSQDESAQEFLWQIEELIANNEKELESSKQSYKERCIRAAQTVAYYVASNDESLSSVEAAEELADLLEIDEIHYYTPEGVLYAGTSPKYYGYTFDSGVQMSFFKPMLEDKELQLCQDLMPNTAEQKEMQYAAVWMADGSGIVQIGMAPKRLLQLIDDNDLQNVISQIPFDINGYMHVVDVNDHQIVASTSQPLLGYTFDEATWNSMDKEETHQNFNHRRFCIYMREYNQYLLIRTYDSSVILNQVIQSTIMVVLFLIMLSISIGIVVQWYLKHRILNGLYEINDALKESESGDLKQIEIQTKITEFNDLLFYINRMLRNIRDNWNKLSYIIDKGNIPMGIYEINHFYHKTFMNQKVIDLFGVQKQDRPLTEVVYRCIEDTLSHLVDEDEHIYQYNEQYLKIDTIKSDESETYYITDATLWWSGYTQMKEYSEIDPLTQLYNRRGFYGQMNALYNNKHQLKHHAMLMIDADGLKRINDIDGHDMGDRYLSALASLIRKTLPSQTISARFGGDEFVLFIYGFENEEKLNAIIEVIKASRGKTFIEGKDDTLEFSIGVSYGKDENSDYHSLLKEADHFMYLEKRERKQK